MLTLMGMGFSPKRRQAAPKDLINLCCLIFSAEEMFTPIFKNLFEKITVVMTNTQVQNKYGEKKSLNSQQKV